MFIATIVNSKRFRTYEYLCALSICAGLVLFAMADYSLDPIEFHPAGLLLVGGSVVADAVLPNAQERLFMDGSSRLEVTVYSNFFIFVGMTTATLANGTLPRFLGVVARDGTLALYFGTYAVLSYISISCYMTLVKRFGGVTAVVLTTARKAMTLVLSFVLFPKGFSWLYVHGSLLVLGAVMMASVCKKMGIGKGDGPSPSSRGGKGGGGEYISLAYGNDGRDLESGGVKKLRASAPSSSSSSSHGFSLEGSQLEKSAAAILDGISKRAYT
jgi:adenosine 3'-phospho 5'-phosphosulfate transporter B3